MPSLSSSSPPSAPSSSRGRRSSRAGGPGAPVQGQLAFAPPAAGSGPGSGPGSGRTPDDPPAPASATAAPPPPRPQAGPAASAAVPAPEDLHPALWRAHQLGRGGERVQPSGHPALDAELPGGGWPHRALTELLSSGPGQGEIRLLAPVLARVTAAGHGVLLVGPPADPCAAAWLQLGIDLDHCVLVRGDDLLWPIEQALRSGQVGALLAWPGDAMKADALRRLQLAAQSHDGPAFLFRSPGVARQPSPAPLRLALEPAGPDALAVRLLKRRGPLREEPVRIELPPVLPPGARERARRPSPSPARPRLTA